MQRLIQKEIKDAITDDILFGSLQRGGRVSIDVSGEKPERKLDFSIEPLAGSTDADSSGEEPAEAKDKKEEEVTVEDAD